MRKLVLSLLLVVFGSSWACAESSVWKAQKKGSTVYLGGTFHMLRQSDFPLPPEFEKAYRASDAVVFETDIGAIQEPSTQQKILAKAVYPDGSTIDSHLSAKAYRELREFCESNAIPLEAFSHLRPAMLMTTLTLLELMKFGVSQQGVDVYFHQRARQDHKAVQGLEPIDQHIDYLVSLGDGDENEFVTYAIKDMHKVEELFEMLVGAWRTGDADKLDRLLVTDLKKEQPRVYQKLLVDRNRKWLPQIEAYEKTRKTVFVLVGAAHLVGKDGLVESLRKKGYQVTKL